MIHHWINESGDHYAVAPNAFRTHVLLQVQESGEQVRIPLTPEQARHTIALLEDALGKVEGDEGPVTEPVPDPAS